MIYQVKSFSFVFLENLGHHKLLSKLTDLYQESNFEIELQMWVGMTFITGLLAVVRNFCFFAFPLFQCLLTIFGTFFILARFWAFILDLKSCSSCSVGPTIKPNKSNRCNINLSYIEGLFLVSIHNRASA